MWRVWEGVSSILKWSLFLTLCKDTSSVRYAKQLESTSYMRVFSIIIRLHISNCPKLAAVWRGVDLEGVSSKVEWSSFLAMCKDTSSVHYDKQLESTSSGNVLEIWICGYGCSLFSGFSKSVAAHSTRSLKISGCKRVCSKDLRVRAPAAPVLTHSLDFSDGPIKQI